MTAEPGRRENVGVRPKHLTPANILHRQRGYSRGALPLCSCRQGLVDAILGAMVHCTVWHYQIGRLVSRSWFGDNVLIDQHVYMADQG